MTSHEDDADVVGTRRRGDVPAQPRARAYTGPAHGLEWSVGGEGPAPWVELPLGAGSCLYRLVRQRRTGWPARDQRGNYLYVPISGAAPPPEDVDACRVLPFPTGPAIDQAIDRGGGRAAVRRRAGLRDGHDLTPPRDGVG